MLRFAPSSQQGSRRRADRAEHAARRHDDEVALRADALTTVIRNITTAHLVGDDARILTLTFKAEEHPRSRTFA